jgi:hypothetical protein
MRKSTLLLAVSVLAGCATNSGGNNSGLAVATPALKASIEKSFDLAIPPNGFGGDYTEVRDCVTKSFLTGVPADDLMLMESSVEKDQDTPNERIVVGYWFGPSAVHGLRRLAQANPDGGILDMKQYADGTPFDGPGEDRIRQRVRHNANVFCPGMVARYPAVFGT